MKRVFISYSHDDTAFRDQLVVHLAVLQRQGTIDVWHDGRIEPGNDWKKAIEEQLQQADIIILLISASFLASRFCAEVELTQAMRRWEAKNAIVVPIIVRACDWASSPLGRLQALPRDGRPISQFNSFDDAWRDVARSIKSIASDDNQETRIGISLETEGDALDFDESKKLRAESELRKATMDPSLLVVRVRRGSIILELEMSGQAAEVLMRLVETGELKTVLGYEIRRASSGGPQPRVAQPRKSDSSLLPGQTIKLLFLSANPIDTDRLALDQEVRPISQHLRACRLGRQIQLIQRWAVQPDDILQTMNEERPDIVHFSGHGGITGEIRLADRNGLSCALDVSTLKRLFAVFHDSVRVVVLNACYSAKQARVISRLVDCTVGMSRDITDTAAAAFSSSFYRAIGFGTSVKGAFDQGVLSMCLEGFSAEHRIPKLNSRSGIDPSIIHLCG